MSVNLAKGGRVNLTKQSDRKLRHIDLGLGWNTRTDLDSFAFIIDNHNQIVNTVYFGNKTAYGISLNGDNLTGGGGGDDEIISVDFDKIPDYIVKIKFGANIFAAGIKLWGVKKFSQVKNAYIRLVNKDNNTELCRYNLTEDGKNFNAFLFADLCRQSDGSWTFEAVGQGVNGSIDAIRSYIKANNLI